MIIALKEITNAVAKVKSVAGNTKTPVGILLKVHETELHICYSDGRRSVIDKVQIEPQETDVTGEYVVDFNKFIYLIEMCQASGTVKADTITIGTDREKKVMLIRADKYTAMQSKETSEDGTESYVEVKRKTSTISQQLGYSEPNESIKYGVLTRMDYEDAYTQTMSDSDTYSTSTFKSLMKKLLYKDDFKPAYISAKHNSGYEIMLTHTLSVPCAECVNNGFVVNSSLIKSIIGVLNNMDTDEVKVKTVDKRYVNITSGNTGLWFEMAQAQKMDGVTLNSYTSVEYADYEFVVYRDSFADIIDNYMKTTKSDRLTLKFGLNALQQKQMLIEIADYGASTAGVFSIMLEGEVKNFDSLCDTSIVLSTKAVKETLNGCEAHYVVIGVSLIETDKKMIRIAEAKGRKEDNSIDIGVAGYMLGM